MTVAPRVGVIIVTWNSEKYLFALVESLKQVDYLAGKWRVFFVDNHSEDGTVEILQRVQIIDDRLQIIELEQNYGFAKACNIGAREAMIWNAEYLYFLNPDTEVDKDFLTKSIKVFEQDKIIGQVQSLTLREGGREIQSWGNSLTFLGFGYSGGDGSMLTDFFARELGSPPEAETGRIRPRLKNKSGRIRPSSDSARIQKSVTIDPHKEGNIIQEIGYASGAAMMVPVNVWQEVGGFDEIYGSFHEDTDLSLRIRLSGRRIVLASESRVIHKYQFARSIANYYYLERNRMILGLKFFKMPTLIIFFPAFFVMEVGTLAYSFLNGFWKEKLKAYVWMVMHLEKVWTQRMELQRTRKLGDRELAKYLVARVEFQEVMNPILQYIVNPVTEGYWSVVRKLIVW